MKKILVIVDFQYDFCNPNGALYVPGAEKAKEAILKEIESNKYDIIVFTADFHPEDHCSFKENGGQWPTHCIKSSKGWLFENPLIHKAVMDDSKLAIFTKGSTPNEEEYGIDLLPRLEIEFGITQGEMVFCGLAGDYCVLETLRMNLDNFDCSVLLDGIASIDGGEKLNKFIKENNIKIC